MPARRNRCRLACPKAFPCRKTAQEPTELPFPRPYASQAPQFFPAIRDKQPPLEWRSPPPMNDRGLPIDLPSALRLVDPRSLDIAIAVQQIEKSRAEHDLAKYIWLPTIQLGGQYYRHDGPIENAFGATEITPVTSANLGAGV